jgi:N-acetyl-anhydromuramyl-L-alanine amidase AmpD
MRKINRLIIHTSASPNSLDVGVKEIREWHLQKGWKDIGYHFVIRRNGVLEKGRPIEQVGAHVAGHNADSIGICLVGEGTSLDYVTSAQAATLRRVVGDLKVLYPKATIHGHREYANKLCPGFDIKDFPWEDVAPVKLPSPDRLTWWQRITKRKA